jgi:hypothetical protein
MTGQELTTRDEAEQQGRLLIREYLHLSFSAGDGAMTEADASHRRIQKHFGKALDIEACRILAVPDRRLPGHNMIN